MSKVSIANLNPFDRKNLPAYVLVAVLAGTAACSSSTTVIERVTGSASGTSASAPASPGSTPQTVKPGASATEGGALLKDLQSDLASDIASCTTALIDEGRGMNVTATVGDDPAIYNDTGFLNKEPASDPYQEANVPAGYEKAKCKNTVQGTSIKANNWQMVSAEISEAGPDTLTVTTFTLPDAEKLPGERTCDESLSAHETRDGEVACGNNTAEVTAETRPGTFAYDEALLAASIVKAMIGQAVLSPA